MEYAVAVKSATVSVSRFALISLLVLSVFQTGAQTTISRVLVSERSGSPVPYAHVYFQDRHTNLFEGVLTDIDGRFFLRIQKETEADSLNISCVGFATMALSLDGIPKDTIYIPEVETLLPTVVISDMTAAELLGKCIQHIPTNYQNARFVNKAFHWKTLKIDSTYTRLVRSFVTIEEFHTPEKTIKRVLYDSISALTNGKSSREIIEYDTLSEHLYFDLIRTGPSILNTSQLNEWQISYAYEHAIDPDRITIIEAVSSGRFVNNYKFFIDNQDFALKRIEFHYKWPHNGPFDSRIKLVKTGPKNSGSDSLYFSLKDLSGAILYEKTDQKYNVKYLQNRIEYVQYKKSTDVMVPLQSSRVVLHNELTITRSKELPIDSGERHTTTTDHPMEPTIINTREFDRALKSLTRPTSF